MSISTMVSNLLADAFVWSSVLFVGWLFGLAVGNWDTSWESTSSENYGETVDYGQGRGDVTDIYLSDGYRRGSAAAFSKAPRPTTTPPKMVVSPSSAMPSGGYKTGVCYYKSPASVSHSFGKNQSWTPSLHRPRNGSGLAHSQVMKPSQEPPRMSSLAEAKAHLKDAWNKQSTRAMAPPRLSREALNATISKPKIGGTSKTMAAMPTTKSTTTTTIPTRIYNKEPQPRIVTPPPSLPPPPAVQETQVDRFAAMLRERNNKPKTSAQRLVESRYAKRTTTTAVNESIAKVATAATTITTTTANESIDKVASTATTTTTTPAIESIAKVETVIHLSPPTWTGNQPPPPTWAQQQLPVDAFKAMYAAAPVGSVDHFWAVNKLYDVMHASKDRWFCHALNTWQGRTPGSAATCATNAFLASAAHLDVRSPNFIEPSTLESIIDVVAPPMAHAICVRGGRNPQSGVSDGQPNSYCFQDEVLQYLVWEGGLPIQLERLGLDPQTVRVPIWKTVFHGNMMGSKLFDDFLQYFSQDTCPELPTLKRSATIFCHQHVISVHRGTLPDGEVAYQFVDTLKLTNEAGAVSVTFKDVNDLKVVLQKYAYEAYFQRYTKEDLPGLLATQDSNDPLHPLKFEAYIFVPDVEAATETAAAAATTATEAKVETKTAAQEETKTTKTRRRVEFAADDQVKYFYKELPVDPTYQEDEEVHMQNMSLAWNKIVSENNRRRNDFDPALTLYEQDLRSVALTMPAMFKDNSYFDPLPRCRKSMGDEILAPSRKRMRCC